MKRTAKCKHRRVAADKRCKDCGQSVNLTAKRSKYGNRRTDGFDSAKEARRFKELQLEQYMGLISELKTQVWFDLIVEGILICRYRADFTYQRNGKAVTEDVKGLRTPVYRLKKLLMKACYNIDIFET